MKKKILIIRLGAIGDVIHTSVIQKSIKMQHPDAEVHLLTSYILAPLMKNDKYLDKLFVFDSSNKDNPFYLLSLGLKFRREKYDAVINLSNSMRNIFLMFLASPKKKIKRCTEPIHAVQSFFQSAKEVYDDLDLPKNLTLAVDVDVQRDVQKMIEDYPRPFVIFSPGGEHNNERQGRVWPIQSWKELGKLVSNKFGGTIFVIGSPAERQNHLELENLENIKIYTGKLTLEQSAALSSEADLFISGDSGPLHIASALNVTTLGLMGSTSPQFCSPYGEQCHTILPKSECAPCHLKICSKLELGEDYTPCMKSITADDIMNLIDEKGLL
ncbi:MAG: glycosyltransferase family 9 protein [Candidatus Gastranaerophilales bacterium]|nr:glycosyltransferase family 9 protein [Candidatus Gastranaerophilales bacterium]